MKKSIKSIFLLSMFLIILGSGCASTSTPTPPTSLNLEWLVTEKDLNRFTNDIKPYEWELNMVSTPDNTVCRILIHHRLPPVAPTSVSNCIDLVTPGSTFEDLVASKLASDFYSSTDVHQIKPLLKYDYDFALYTYTGDHGQPCYNAFLFNNGLFFHASFSVQAPKVYIPDNLFDEQKEIEPFLKKILMFNLDKVGG